MPDTSAAAPDPERALVRLVETMALVLDADWMMTHEQLGVRAEPWVVAPGATFLNPEVGDESNNWGNRGALLAAYREAVDVLRRRGVRLQDYVDESVSSAPSGPHGGSRG